MTGIYADIPGPRMAIDQDGSTLWLSYQNVPTWTDITAASMVNLIKVDGTLVTATSDGNGGGYMYLTVMFPEPRDFKGISWGSVTYRSGFNDSSSPVRVTEYSTDATAPNNGTWTALGGTGGYQQPFTNPNSVPVLAHRAGIYAQNVAGVKGIRIKHTATAFQGVTFTHAIAGLQIFGIRSASDHLAFWHPTLDQPLDPAAFDFAEVWVGGGKPSRQFRLKNMSATLTANSPSVTYSDITGIGFGTSTVQVSTDNSTFTNSISSLSNIAAGAIGPILYAKLTTVASRTSVNPIAGRLVSSATSWS